MGVDAQFREVVTYIFVMAGLVPDIHVQSYREEDVDDGRAKPGHHGKGGLLAAHGKALYMSRAFGYRRLYAPRAPFV